MSIERIRTRLAQYRCREAAVTPATFEAAVALILHERQAGDPELLFIERAQRVGDPWSGHMAFPGGRRDACDADLLATATRETLEEVGFALGKPLGRLDDVAGSRPPSVRDLVVGAYVFGVDQEPQIQLNAEVQSTVWVPLSVIRNPESWTDHFIDDDRGARTLPALSHGRYRIWGLTLRILNGFFALLGEPLPRRIETPSGEHRPVGLQDPVEDQHELHERRAKQQQ